MCRTRFVLCAAPDEGALGALKRAAVGAEWELVGGATSAEEAVAQAAEWRPDILVFFGAMAPDLAERASAARPGLRTVAIGPGPADVSVAGLEQVREAIAALPGSPGPVR